MAGFSILWMQAEKGFYSMKYHNKNADQDIYRILQTRNYPMKYAERNAKQSSDPPTS